MVFPLYKWCYDDPIIHHLKKKKTYKWSVISYIYIYIPYIYIYTYIYSIYIYIRIKLFNPHEFCDAFQSRSNAAAKRLCGAFTASGLADGGPFDGQKLGQESGNLMGKWWENDGKWWKMMGKWWENDGKMMGKWWEHDGKMMGNDGKWWENDGKMMGKWWENDGKMMGTWWENDGKWWEMMGKWWENDGKWWEMMENDGKMMGKWWETDGKMMGNDGKMMGKWWENDGKMMGTWWENDGKWWENDGKMMGTWWNMGDRSDAKVSKVSFSISMMHRYEMFQRHPDRGFSPTTKAIWSSNRAQNWQLCGEELMITVPTIHDGTILRYFQGEWSYHYVPFIHPFTIQNIGVDDPKNPKKHSPFMVGANLRRDGCVLRFFCSPFRQRFKIV